MSTTVAVLVTSREGIISNLVIVSSSTVFPSASLPLSDTSETLLFAVVLAFAVTVFETSPVST